MFNLKEAREKRAELIKQAEALIDSTEGKQWTNQNQADYNGFKAEIEKIEAGIEAHSDLLERSAGLQADTSAGTWRDKHGNPVAVLGPNHQLSNFGPAGQPTDNFSGEKISAGAMMRALALGPQNQAEIQALSEGTDSAGGYTVPDRVSRQVIDLARAKSHVIKAGALTVPLDTEKTTIARIASDPVPGWRLENSAVTESEPTFEPVSFTARSLAVLVKASRELIEDSVNIDLALQMALAGAMANEVDRVALLGSGVAPEPTGVVNATGVNVLDLGADGAALNGYANMLAAFQMMADGNAEDPTAAIMAPRERFAFAGMVDSNGQPLNRPDMIRDLPFYGTTKIPVDGTHGAANNASKIFLGDFQQLMFGVRSGMRIEVLRERFADSLQIAFVCHLRMDIALAQPKAFTVIDGIIPA